MAHWLGIGRVRTWSHLLDRGGVVEAVPTDSEQWCDVLSAVDGHPSPAMQRRLRRARHQRQIAFALVSFMIIVMLTVLVVAGLGDAVLHPRRVQPVKLIAGSTVFALGLLGMVAGWARVLRALLNGADESVVISALTEPERESLTRVFIVGEPAPERLRQLARRVAVGYTAAARAAVWWSASIAMTWVGGVVLGRHPVLLFVTPLFCFLSGNIHLRRRSGRARRWLAAHPQDGPG